VPRSYGDPGEVAPLRQGYGVAGGENGDPTV
jgi:hypothetical protein